MFQIILITLTFTCAFSAPDLLLVKGDGRIVGGEDVDITDYPYQVSLLLYNSHRCGGSIISDRWVVTAAHCLGYPALWLSVRVGSSIRNSGGTTVGVRETHTHPNYVSSTLKNDIAILYLLASLSFSDTIAPIALADEGQQFDDGVDAHVSGWGRLSYGGQTTSRLQAVIVQIVNQEACGSAYRDLELSISDSMICAGVYGGGKDACQGDSGGPLVVGNQLVGIVSWGEECALADYPGVYASVPALRSYIKLITGI